MKSKRSGRARAPILVKSLEIVRRVVSEHKPLTLKDVASDLRIPEATAHRILSDLEAQGWVVQDRERCRIEIGPSLIGIAAAITWRYGVETAIRPLLASLVRETGETVCLNLYDAPSAQLVAYVVEDSDRPLSYQITPGDASYLHTGASGRAVMAFLDQDGLARVLKKHGLPAVTEKTITSVTRLRRELAEVRTAGFAFSKGERLEEAVGIAAPVFGTNGQIQGSLLVTTPSFRFAAKNKLPFARAAIACAKQLTQLIDSANEGR